MNVSIIIPTYNRKPILKKCLKALENQVLNENISNYEVIVIDDGSTDGTTSWIRNNNKVLSHVVLYEQEHGGPALGRNLGLMKSKYEIIINYYFLGIKITKNVLLMVQLLILLISQIQNLKSIS